MNPTELDESLLTAYLDNELSDTERQQVEEQLKGNTRWQQLKSELENIRTLIRDLPKPVLSRSITTGPWNQTASSSQAAMIDDRSVQPVVRGHFFGKQLALAASLLIGTFGTFALYQFGNQIGNRSAEVARLELQASPASATAMFDGSKKAHDDSIQAPSPESSAIVSLGSRTQDRFEMDFVETIYVNVSKDPTIDLLFDQKGVATLAFSKAKELEVDSLTRMSRADQQNETLELLSIKLGFWYLGTHWELGKDQDSPEGFLVKGSKNRRHEFRFQRSDWHDVAIELQKIGIDLSNDVSIRELTDDDQAKIAGEKFSNKASVSRPPALVGPFAEPADWIRLVITVDDN